MVGSFLTYVCVGFRGLADSMKELKQMIQSDLNLSDSLTLIQKFSLIKNDEWLDLTKTTLSQLTLIHLKMTILNLNEKVSPSAKNFISL